MAEGMFDRIINKLAVMVLGEGEFHRYVCTGFRIVRFPAWTVVDIKVGKKRFRMYPSDFGDDFNYVVDELEILQKDGKEIILFVNPNRASLETDGAIVRIEQAQGEGENIVLLTIPLSVDWKSG